MPYLNPGSLTDRDAQQVAAFITSKPRPNYPFKQRDYPSGKIPTDAVYYNRH
jgi:thiosulfate dehydrogenase